MAKPKKIEWSKIKTEYVTGNKSLRELAEEHGLNQATVGKKSAEEKWPDERKEYRNKVAMKVQSKKASEEAKIMSRLQGASSKLLSKVERTIEISEDDSRSMRELTLAMRELTSVLRNVYGIPTEMEREQLAMAREKLEIERAKSTQYDDDSGETGVILLAPVLEEEDDE